MTPIVVEREGIGEPAAGEDEPLLPRQIGDRVDAPEGLGMSAAGQEARFEQLSRFARRDGAIAAPAAGDLALDERLEPKESARPGAHDRHVEAAPARLGENRARN